MRRTKIKKTSKKIDESKPPVPDRDRLEGVFDESLRGEKFGKHPGQVEVRLRLYIYNPVLKKEVRAPGLQLELLVSTAEEVVQLLQVIREAISNWIKGFIHYK